MRAEQWPSLTIEEVMDRLGHDEEPEEPGEPPPPLDGPCEGACIWAHARGQDCAHGRRRRVALRP